MNAPEAATKTRAAPKQRTAKRTYPAKKLPLASSLGQGFTSQASQRAAAILEVLAGERTPRQAAIALSMTLPNFYIVERKALNGLVKACEPQPKGPPAPGPERKLEALESELARCKRECQRQEALVRATQRAVGLPAQPTPTAQKDKPGDKKGGIRRRRRPVVRALRHARTLRQNSSSLEGTSQLEPMATSGGTDSPTMCQKEMDHVAAVG